MTFNVGFFLDISKRLRAHNATQTYSTGKCSAVAFLHSPSNHTLRTRIPFAVFGSFRDKRQVLYSGNRSVFILKAPYMECLAVEAPRKRGASTQQRSSACFRLVNHELKPPSPKFVQRSLRFRVFGCKNKTLNPKP